MFAFTLTCVLPRGEGIANILETKIVQYLRMRQKVV